MPDEPEHEPGKPRNTHHQVPDGTRRVELSTGGELVVPKTLSIVERPEADYSEEVVAAALWEIAAAGGNCARALRALEQRFEQEVRDGLRLPTDRTLRNWKTGTYRNRYQELLQGSAKELEELVAQKGIDFALRAQQAKVDALAQVEARMGSLDAVEASLVMRNLAQAEAVGVQQAGQLRNRPGFGERDVRDVDQIAAALARLNVVKLVDAESTAEEIPAADVVDGGAPPAQAASGS